MIKVFVVSKGCMAKGRPWAYVVAPVGGIGWFVGVVSRVGWLCRLLGLVPEVRDSDIGRLLE